MSICCMRAERCANEPGYLQNPGGAEILQVVNSYLFSMLSNFARLQSVSLQREKLLEGDSEKFFALFTAISQVSTCHI